MRDVKIENDLLRGAELIRYEECDSTNTRAREYAREVGREAVFLADRQSAGRGRRGRSFLSERGGIYISFLYLPSGEELDIAGITAKAAVLAARAIEAATGIAADIKWVNDLYLNGKKVAGILTEGEFDEEGKLRYYVVGMGINVYKIHSFEEKMPIATTLSDYANCEINFDNLCGELIAAMRGESPSDSELLSEYRRRCNLIGKTVSVHRGDEEYEAVVLGVNEDYSLSVETAEGVRSLNSGEVSLTRLAHS
ncbi:MAG: biotin--[Clostridia bacterium]|nr:biotin--[acetyl-CoA-carboxylase] ligase [Clostridia bacterium]